MVVDNREKLDTQLPISGLSDEQALGAAADYIAELKAEIKKLERSLERVQQAGSW